MPQDYLAVYDSTMARFWFFNDRAREMVTTALRKLPCGRVLSDQELRDLGVLFHDRRYGEVIFLLQAGWIISQSDFNGAGWMPSGMHGYDPADDYSDAIYLSDREPAFELHGVHDVYRCMWAAAREAQ